MKPIDFVLWHTKDKMPKYMDYSLAMARQLPYFTGSLETDVQLLSEIRRGINHAMENVPVETVLYQHALAITNPEGTPAFMTDQGQDLLATVYRSCIYEHATQAQGRPGLMPHYLALAADHACDLTYSGLCHCFYMSNERFGIDPKVALEYGARAKLFDDQRMMVVNRFNPNGTIADLTVEPKHAVQMKNEILLRATTLSDIVAGRYGSDVTQVDIPGGSMYEDLDLDKLQHMEDTADPYVRDRLEAYNREKDRQLQIQSNIRQHQDKMRDQLKVNQDDPAATVDVTLTMNQPTPLYAGQDNHDGLVSPAEPMYDPDRIEKSVEKALKAAGSESMYQHPYNPNMQQPPQHMHQQHQDPFVMTGNLNIGGQPVTIPTHLMLLVDANGTPVRKVNGNFISIPLRSVDCRQIFLDLDQFNQPRFDQEGFPYVKQLVNNQYMPFPLSNTQKAQLGQPQQTLYPSHQPAPMYNTPQQPASDPWAHIRNGAGQEKPQDLQFKVWEQHKPAAPAAAPTNTTPVTKDPVPVWNQWNQPTPTEPVEKEVVIRPADPDPTPSNLDLGKDQFVLETEDGDQIIVAPISTAGFRAFGTKSFENQINYDRRKYFIAVGIVKGKVEEFLINKESFMDRKQHDPHYLTPALGEMRSSKIELIDVEAEGLPCASVNVRDEAISEDNAAVITSIATDIAKDEEKPIIIDLAQQELIPGVPVSRSAYKALVAKIGELESHLQPYFMTTAIIADLRDSDPKVSDFLNQRMAAWWTMALRYRLNKTDTSITVGPEFHDSTTTEDMLGYLRSESLVEEAFRLFNSEYEKLFKLDLVYMGKVRMYQGVMEDLDIDPDNDHTDPEVKAFFDSVDEYSLTQIYDGKLLVCKDLRRDPNIGLVSAATDGILYGLLNGAFAKLDASETIIRVVTGLGTLVTVAVTRRVTGNVYTVIAKHQ